MSFDEALRESIVEDDEALGRKQMRRARAAGFTSILLFLASYAVNSSNLLSVARIFGVLSLVALAAGFNNLGRIEYREPEGGTK